MTKWLYNWERTGCFTLDLALNGKWRDDGSCVRKFCLPSTTGSLPLPGPSGGDRSYHHFIPLPSLFELSLCWGEMVPKVGKMPWQSQREPCWGCHCKESFLCKESCAAPDNAPQRCQLWITFCENLLLPAVATSSTKPSWRPGTPGITGSQHYLIPTLMQWAIALSLQKPYWEGERLGVGVALLGGHRLGGMGLQQSSKAQKKEVTIPSLGRNNPRHCTPEDAQNLTRHSPGHPAQTMD